MGNLPVARNPMVVAVDLLLLYLCSCKNNSSSIKARMNIEQLREYCLSKKGATEDFPFDEETLVIRVMNKIFAILPLERGPCINLKCDPELVVSLREHYRAVEPAYHMNKKHWNTVWGNRDARQEEIAGWIDHSYDLIVNSLTRKLKAELDLL